MRSFAPWRENITTEDPVTTRRRAKEALRILFSPKWPFLVNGLQLDPKHVQTSASSIFGIEPLHNLYLTTSKLLEEFTVVFPGYNTLHSHRSRLACSKKTLTRMQRPIF